MRIFLNGEFVPEDQARVSVLDRCFLYGDGIFEGIAVWDGAPFKLDPHLRRMQDGLDYLRIDNPYSDSRWADLIAATIAHNRMENGYLRVQISRGEGISSIKWEKRLLKKPEPNLTIIPIKGFNDYYKGLLAEKMASGLRATILSRPRIPAAALPSGAKHCNYLNSVLGAIEVTSAQADVGIAVDGRGFVSEGIAYNVFIARDGVIRTAPTTSDILPGITRKVLIETARENGIVVVEQVFDALTMCSADEVFITSTLEFAVPVVEIAGRRIGDGRPGPIARKLGDALISAMTTDARKWHEARQKEETCR